MQLENKELLQILLKGSYITEHDIKEAEAYLATHRISLIDYLLQKKLINRDLLGQAIAESFQVSYGFLHSSPPSAEQVAKIPEDIAKKYHAAVSSTDGKKMVIATDNPRESGIRPALEKVFPKADISLVYSLTEDIDAAFVHYQKPLETRFSKIIEKKQRIAPELLEEIFEDALAYNASDIHFEPRHDDVLVRFRVDGVLKEAGRIPREYYENILNRIKVQSGLRIDEHAAAQDGALQYKGADTSIDMRASIVPTVQGEKAVLRVLGAYVQGFSLGDLGLSLAHQAVLESAAQKPFGMILVVGPTGSGKTTTLYALLKLNNMPDVNITTIEDPVEYIIQGVNQIQVNQQTNLTFAKALRSIVRQDPDTILVGEIRDTETAEIAVNAALTGHLLFSTFHANDAATAIPRLLDMGVEPFLLASTIEVIIAQRLVRKICDHCRYSKTVSVEDLKRSPLSTQASSFFQGGSITLYEGKGCEICGKTGYKGRTAIYEFIRMTDAMQNLILHAPSTMEIWKQARIDGSRSLFEDGLEKVKTGITTLDELLRVAEPPRHQ